MYISQQRSRALTGITAALSRSRSLIGDGVLTGVFEVVSGGGGVRVWRQWDPGSPGGGLVPTAQRRVGGAGKIGVRSKYQPPLLAPAETATAYRKAVCSRTCCFWGGRQPRLTCTSFGRSQSLHMGQKSFASSCIPPPPTPFKFLYPVPV